MLGGQQAWLDHAAALQGRLALLQVHVQPDWLYAVCTRCGWDLELNRALLPDFRYSVATHDCSGHRDVSPVAAADDAELVLF
jgi:hypothetical protein